MNIAAYVRGYYLTAAHRFVDSAALAVHSGLFHGIVEAIEAYLYESLGLRYESGEWPSRLFSQSAHFSFVPRI